jgi:hypothetical protein
MRRGLFLGRWVLAGQTSGLWVCVESLIMGSGWIRVVLEGWCGGA